MTNEQKLRKIMDENGLTRPEAAKLIGVALNTLDGWLAPVGAKTHRKMADRHLEHLELKIDK
jgi:hypothetical protein